jgi:hypothetical protein
MIRSVVGCTVLGLAALTFGACSSDSGETVNVAAADYSLEPDVSSVAAGDIKFKIKNNGTFTHEMVVFKIADASDIPTKPDGEVNEDGVPEADRMGEVEDILPGKTETLKLKLAAGKYVMFCNRVDGKTVHFKKGMHTNFTVTAAS